MEESLIVNVQHTVDVALQFVEAINRRDLGRLDDLMTEDPVFVDLAGERAEGKAVMQEGWNGYFTQCPDYMIHISALHVIDESVVLVGRTTGSHLNLPRLDEFRESLLWVAGIRGDRVAEWRLLPDTPASYRTLRLGQAKRLV